MHFYKEPPPLTLEELKENAKYARDRDFNACIMFGLSIGIRRALEKNNLVDVRKIALMRQEDLAKILPSPVGFSLKYLRRGLREVGLDFEMTELPLEYRD